MELGSAAEDRTTRGGDGMYLGTGEAQHVQIHQCMSPAGLIASASCDTGARVFDVSWMGPGARQLHFSFMADTEQCQSGLVEGAKAQQWHND